MICVLEDRKGGGGEREGWGEVGGGEGDVGKGCVGNYKGGRGFLVEYVEVKEMSEVEEGVGEEKGKGVVGGVRNMWDMGGLEYVVGMGEEWGMGVGLKRKRLEKEGRWRCRGVGWEMGLRRYEVVERVGGGVEDGGGGGLGGGVGVVVVGVGEVEVV